MMLHRVSEFGIWNSDIIPRMLETITLAAGCYWCTEAVFLQLRGVVGVEPGFASDPGQADAEGVQVQFDPAQISIEQLFTVYFATHDPTQLNRQGPDEGAEYRSAIFAHTPAQHAAATAALARLTAERTFAAPIVTQIRSFVSFMPADARQRRYYARNSTNAHCQVVITPKLVALRKTFAALVTTTA
jgi:peptide-methionine (S)-S-oxide reductase